MSYQQVTLATMQQRLAERYESSPYWTAEEARRALNEGLRIFSAATGFWREAVLTQTVPNDPYVALPGTLVGGSRVTWNELPLESASLADFDYAIPNWRGTTTASPGAPARPLYWARVGLSQLAIYPADAYVSIAGTHSLIINGIRSTPVMTNPSDFVNLGQEQHDILLGYAAHVLAFKLGGDALVATYPAWLALLKAAGDLNREFAASLFYRRVMGLDQLRRSLPSEKPVQSLADLAVMTDGQTLGE